MTIWQLRGDNDYNSTYLVNEHGKQMYEDACYFFDLQTELSTRKLLIKKGKKGFADMMYYDGVSGSCVVNRKVRMLIEEYFGDLDIQFFPCHCEQYPDREMWILNVCEYYDVFDVENSVYKTIINHKGEERISFIKKIAFTKEAFGLDIFKIYIDGYKSIVCLYVSDRFKAIMEENGVTGLVLEKVYSV